MNIKMDKVEIIRSLIDCGRFKDILDFVEGESKYISESSGGAPQDKNLRRIWILVVHHLRFLSKFGNVSEVMKGDKCFTAHSKEFELWLDAGAPGISEQDLRDYLKENPL